MSAVTQSASSPNETFTACTEIPLKMKAWFYEDYGYVNVLRLDGDTSVPKIRVDQVLIIKASPAHDSKGRPSVPPATSSKGLSLNQSVNHAPEPLSKATDGLLEVVTFL
ncbi:hypothetical protein KSP39_PZI013394 [Platanthera zijinensis]|uniref:Uncharacterized protein n=1 Tax=Platanthera zijinensis TaxID=2320716 RepID=A0AAP0G3B1_9ASPA